MNASDDNRRRYPRHATARRGVVHVDAIACDVVVKDVSAGGCFVELAGGVDVGLGVGVVVDVDGVRVAGRVVRVRRGGKDRGVPVARGAAVEFVDVDADAIAVFARMAAPVDPDARGDG